MIWVTGDVLAEPGSLAIADISTGHYLMSNIMVETGELFQIINRLGLRASLKKRAPRAF